MSLGHVGPRWTVWWLTCLPLVITAFFFFGEGGVFSAAVSLWWPIAYTAYVHGRSREREKYDKRAYLTEGEYDDGGLFS